MFRLPSRVAVPVLWLAWTLLTPGTTAADWTVIPYGQSPSRSAQRASELLVRALQDRRVPVVSLHETRDRFRSRAPWPEDPSPETRARLAQYRTMAIEHAAYGRHDAARKAAQQAIDLASPHLEALNRDTSTAHDLLDACLAIVRVDLQRRDRRRAVSDAMRCRQLVPDLTPRQSLHSSEVIGALAEAENQLRRSGSETLLVEVEGESNCAVFLNGRRLGSAPFRWEHGPPGDARVEIECGSQRSRVHIVNLGEREVTLRIAPARDGRVRDEGILALWYASADDEHKNLIADAKAVGNLIGADQVVLAHETANGDVLLVRYELARSRAVASTEVRRAMLDGIHPAAWEAAADALQHERIDTPLPLPFVPGASEPAIATAPAARSAPAPQAITAADDSPEVAAPVDASQALHPLSSDQRPPRRPRIWTWVLGGVAVASAGVGIGLGVAATNKNDDFGACESNCDALRSSGQSLQLGANIAYGAAGALLAGSVVAFFLEGRSSAAPGTALLLHPRGIGLSHRF